MGKVRVKAENSTFLTFSWSSATKTNSLLACVLLQGAAALHIDTHTCLAIAKLVIPFSLFFPVLTFPPSFHICVTTFFFLCCLVTLRSSFTSMNAKRQRYLLLLVVSLLSFPAHLVVSLFRRCGLKKRVGREKKKTKGIHLLFDTPPHFHRKQFTRIFSCCRTVFFFSSSFSRSRLSAL